MSCPCEDCLCVPICRHKVYVELVKCSLVEKYLIEPLMYNVRPPKRVVKVEKILNPITWTNTCSEYGVFITLKKV